MFWMKNQPVRNTSPSAFRDTCFLTLTEVTQCCYVNHTGIVDNLFPRATFPKVSITLDNLFLGSYLLERYGNSMERLA